MTFLSAVSGQLISHSAARFEQAALVSKCFPNKGLTFGKIDKYFITQATNQPYDYKQLFTNSQSNLAT
ncbi:hypothetical protein T05_196 [Trichinella murrelli]|uniref:Uncharacterized protein n=1 Tax=Trichinella murrelli TaxID=144512 RepID=A0A0V0UE28_9BILA|nr:hypothetical protein T05_196 [Trichinella murrelli]